MITYEITIAKRVLRKGKEVVKSYVEELKLPSDVSEISLKKWSDFHIARKDCPNWFLEIETMDKEKREAALKEWTEQHWIEFYLNVADLLTVFCDKDIRTLLGNPKATDIKDRRSGDGIIAMYAQLSSMILSYVPKKIQGFSFKGKQYVIPLDLIDQIGRVWTGAEMSTMTAVEALQVEHVLNAKNEKGEFILEDRKYQTDVALIACLSRMVLSEDEDGDKRIEEMPLDRINRTKWIDRRMKLFGNIPMDLGLDISFFLLRSKSRYMNTLTFSMLSQTLQKALTI